MLSNKVYDVLKAITMVVIPAISTMYFALCGIWGLPYGEQVVGTLAAIGTFLGSLLTLSSSKWKREQKENTLFTGGDLEEEK